MIELATSNITNDFSCSYFRIF